MRSVFDKLISWTGVAIAALLLVAGGLLTWANTFVGNQVHDQLVMQGITMPSGKALEGLPKADANALRQYAGSKLDSGPEAKAFADHYILVHMNKSSNGRTYEEVSGEFMALTKSANPDPAKVKELGDLRQSLFMGNTLRGMLLNAYAFGTMATIAGYGAMAAFGGAGLLVLLSLLGLLHLRRVPAAQEVRLGGAAPAPAMA
jgi:hypothetical protein